MNYACKFILITITLFVGFACKKDPEVKVNNYHELIEGRKVIFNFYHSSGYQSIYGIFNFIKNEENRYSLIGDQGQLYKVDSVILNPNNDNVSLSKIRHYYSNDPHYETYFKNAHTLSEDSIIGEFYDAYYYVTTTRQWIPTHGTFAMKINK